VGLTSPALSYLLAILAAGLLLAIVVYWPRLAGRDLRAIALRSVSLVTLQAFVLALIFVTVNRSGEFYSSWSDLFGSDRASAAVVAAAGVSSKRIRPVVVTSRTAVRVPGDKAAGGVLETVTFSGQLSGIKVGGAVFLPAGYQQGGPVGHYPVLVEISNDLGSSSSPYGATRLAESAAQQIALRQLAPMIIVMLPAALSSTDQGCLDIPARAAGGGSPAGPAILAATFFAEDIPAIMESEYAASNKTANWGLLGDSSGGYCALQLALTSSWTFAAAVAPDGAYSQPPGPVVDAGSPQFQLQDNLLWLLHNQPRQPVSVLFTGSGSGSGAGQAQAFVAAARHPMRVSTAALDGGSWPLASVLRWVGMTIGPRAPQIQPGLAG
jgi:enterochelin esterase-like enzyme